jgi:FixJ family two-component response regulator
MTDDDAIVHIVENDDSARVATARTLKAVGYAVEAHASATEFLCSASRLSPGCLLLDVRLPDINGMEFEAQFVDSPGALPIIFVMGQGSIPMSVRAIQSGAIDFLIKPVHKQALLDAIARALMRDAENRARGGRLQQARERYERLTPREREVFAHLTDRVSSTLRTGDGGCRLPAGRDTLHQRTIEHRPRVFSSGPR